MDKLIIDLLYAISTSPKASKASMRLLAATCDSVLPGMASIMDTPPTPQVSQGLMALVAGLFDAVTKESLSHLMTSMPVVVPPEAEAEKAIPISAEQRG